MGVEDALLALDPASFIVIVIGNRYLEATDSLPFRAARIEPFGCPLIHEIAEVVEFYAVILFVERDDHVLVSTNLGVLFDRHVVSENLAGSVHHFRPVAAFPVAIGEVQEILVQGAVVLE